MMKRDIIVRNRPPYANAFQRGMDAAGEKKEDWIDQFGQVRFPITEMWLEPLDWLDLEPEAVLIRTRRGEEPNEHPKPWAIFHALEAHCLEASGLADAMRMKRAAM